MIKFPHAYHKIKKISSYTEFLNSHLVGTCLSMVFSIHAQLEYYKSFCIVSVK